MRRAIPLLIIGAAVAVGTLIIPGGRASAEKTTPVEVTNIPLPVTVGNFPAIQSVAGTVGATQSGVWNVKLTTPRPFVGFDVIELPDTVFYKSCDGQRVAPAGTIVETISVRTVMPGGQKAIFGMCSMNETQGGSLGTVYVPLQLQVQFPGTFNNPAVDSYVGTLTNVHIPIGAGSAAQPARFDFQRDSSSGPAAAVVSYVGTPGS